MRKAVFMTQLDCILRSFDTGTQADLSGAGNSFDGVDSHDGSDCGGTCGTRTNNMNNCAENLAVSCPQGINSNLAKYHTYNAFISDNRQTCYNVGG